MVLHSDEWYSSNSPSMLISAYGTPRTKLFGKAFSGENFERFAQRRARYTEALALARLGDLVAGFEIAVLGNFAKIRR